MQTTKHRTNDIQDTLMQTICDLFPGSVSYQQWTTPIISCYTILVNGISITISISVSDKFIITIYDPINTFEQICSDIDDINILQKVKDFAQGRINLILKHFSSHM